ncbi:proline dehydrogenase family protein [soil metagenome]
MGSSCRRFHSPRETASQSGLTEGGVALSATGRLGRVDPSCAPLAAGRVVLSLYRSTVLNVSGFPPVARAIRRYGFRLGARRFVAGHDVEEALPALRELEGSGRAVIVDVLGEYVSDVERARAMAVDVAATIDALHAAGIPPVVSLKPTQLALALDTRVASDLAIDLARRTEGHGGRIALDMEDVRYVDGTLDLLRALWDAGLTRSSGVLQAYLHRTPDDLETLLEATPDVSSMELRIVKGAYHESPDVAFHDVPTIRRAYVALAERAWRAGAKVNVATHDDGIITELVAYARGAGLGPERIEFQLLYGMKPKLQADLVQAGHSVRIYVPVGRDWYGYFSRRLAERPANLALVLRGLVR